jgi:hypothetical protein
MLIFFPLPPHVHKDFVVAPSGCGRNVTDFWAPIGYSYVAPLMLVRMICMSEVPGGALNPDQGRYGDLPLQGKISTAEPGIEPGTHG